MKSPIVREMKPLSLLSLFLISILVLGGCEPTSPTMQPAQGMQPPSPTIPPATATPVPTSTLTPAITDTISPAPTLTVSLPTTPTLVDTLEPEKVEATIQPLLIDPMNCATPCFWGIVPGKTPFDEAKAFFSRLGYTPFEGKESGKDFYTITYKPGGDYDFSVTLDTSNDLVDSIVIKPRIAEPNDGGPRKWIAYSPETLIKRYGKPWRVEFALDWGPNFEIVMILYFDPSDLIVYYLGRNMIPDRPRSPRLCPLTAPFDHVRLWMGNAPHRPPAYVSLEKATSLTIDQFTQLMLGDPQQACFTINGEVFQ